MRNHKSQSLAIARFCLAGILFSCTLHGEEGMWTFDNPPAKQIKDQYDFIITPTWLDHVRLSSVRFNDGGSGSFVSPHGLVLTNHHVAMGQLQKVSTPEKDYAQNSFYARNAAEEMKCPDLELNVLISMKDVTSLVQGAVKPGMSDMDAFEARKSEMARIEKESLTATGLRSDVVTLYSGAEYWLYRYKKYTDVRLVFAPEQQIAYFGGDPDNFTYPRYDLDMALFRVYENGRPVESKEYLKWNSGGAQAGELVFVSGNPGNTDRLSTMKQIEMKRDYTIPGTLKLIRRRLDELHRYATGGTEQTRQAMAQILSLENALKAYQGQYNGLLSKALMDKKQKEETDFRTRVKNNAELEKKYGKAWDAIAEAQQKAISRYKELRYRGISGSRIQSLASTIVQYVSEVKKPDGERLEGFHDSELESLRFRLFSPAPIYPQMEIVLLANSLQESLDELGPNDPFVKAALNDRSPEAVARQLVTGTKLLDPAFRKTLVEGGKAAVDASEDPALVLARKLDPLTREVQKWSEDNVENVMAAAGEKIGQARFAVYGKSAYPDATFTLRLTYGTVKGYPMNGTQAPPKTTFYGLFDRSYGFSQNPPFDLPDRYLKGKDRLDLSIPLNFVNNCDIIGGNSGSPVINRNAEIVGLIFDGNIESLVGDYVYNEEDNRSVAVHTAAMIEALRKLYDAGNLANELEGR